MGCGYTPGVAREVEGPRERGRDVTKSKAERGLEQKVMVHSCWCGQGGRKGVSLGRDAQHVPWYVQESISVELGW